MNNKRKMKKKKKKMDLIDAKTIVIPILPSEATAFLLGCLKCVTSDSGKNIRCCSMILLIYAYDFAA
jgi:hypothetical protein